MEGVALSELEKRMMYFTETGEMQEDFIQLNEDFEAEYDPDEYEAKRRYFAANAIGGYPFVGTPDRVAEELATISRAGMRGIALSFVNYLLELPYFCDEVLPRLARLGLRCARSPH